MAEEGEGKVISTRKRKSTEPIAEYNEEKGANEDGPPPEKIIKANEDTTSTEEANVQGSISAENSSEGNNTDSKYHSQDGPPPEKIIKANEDTTSTKEANVQGSISAENSSKVNNTDSKCHSQDGPPPAKIIKANEDTTSTEEANDVQGSILVEISSKGNNTDSKCHSQDDEQESSASIESESIPEVDSNHVSPEGVQIQNDIESTSNTDMNDRKSTSEADVTINDLNGEEDSNSQHTLVKSNENKGTVVKISSEDLESEVEVAFEDDLITLDATGNISLSIDNEAKSTITISFDSKEAYECYGQEFLAFSKKYSEFEVSQDARNLSINLMKNQDVNINHYSTNWKTIDKYDIETDLDAINQQKTSKKKQSKAKKELFTLDATPSISTVGSGCQYTTKFVAISNEPREENDGNSVKKQHFATCFNCDGTHALRDCPAPKDYYKINQARNNFQKKFQQSSRYHADDEQKFSHISAGTISAALRTALGLRDNQVPSYVYRMRIYGYPPGWIEEATEHGSSMAVFGIDGKVADTGKGGSRFNAAKMVHYAGFNVKMEKGMRDEHAKNNVPPFSKEHSTDAMLNYIRQRESTLNDNKEVLDMDVDNDEDGNKDGNDEDEEEVVEDVSPPGCEDESSSNDTKTSLGDLESQKQQLLEELNESQSRENSQDTETVPNNNEANSVKNTTLELANTTLETTKPSCPQEHSTPSNRLKDSEFGTPIIKSASPYSHLPNPENFSVGVSDIINFENLPNSTGAYEKMTGLISKVRETLKSLQEPAAT